MKIVDLSIRRPVSVFIFSVAAVVFGWVAFSKLAVNLLPEITYPTVTVRTVTEGTAPIEVETLLTRPVENAVGVVNNVVRVTSSSRADVSEVTLELAWGTDMDLASLDVREHLDSVELPVEVERPVLLRFDPDLDPIMRIGVFGSDDLGRLRFIADEDVRRRLERLDGVAAVVVSGGLEEEVQVEVDEDRLAGFGLSIEQVVARLAAENINLTGGVLRDGSTEYLVRTLNEVVRASDLEDIVLLGRAGAVIRLDDVASIRVGHKEREVITRIGGRETVELAVYKEGGANTVTVSDRVSEALAGLQTELQRVDPELGLEVVTDQARYIRQAVNEVLSTAFYGGLLAIAVLYLFLRSAAKTAIIGVVIPVSVVATFFVMYVFDISLNIMSLGGLTLGVGLLVDNAIVVLEAVQRKSEEGLDAVEAARAGTSEVGRAITASTLTTVCVFVPIVFVEGVAAQLFRDQALTVACSLVVSLVVALTLIPMLASRRLSQSSNEEHEGGGRGVRWTVVLLTPIRAVVVALVSLLAVLFRPVLDLFEFGLTGFTRAYEATIDRVLLHPWLTVLATVTVLVASMTLVPGLGRELIPELVQGELYAAVEMPPGTRLEVTDRRLSALASAASSLNGVRSISTTAGASSEQGGAAGELRENVGQLTLSLMPPVSREHEDEVMASIRQAVDADNQVLGERRDGEPVVAARFGRPSYFSFRTAIEVEIAGHNLALLERLALEAAHRMRRVPGLADVRSSTEGGHPELEVRFNRDRLASYDLTVATVADVIRAKIQGEVATDIVRSDRTVGIRVRVEEAARDSAVDLENLAVAQVAGVVIPLGAVATVVEREGPAEIRRADGVRVASISANLDKRDLGSVVDDISSVLGSMTWPEGYDWSLAGQEEEMATSFTSLRLALALAVFMVYLVMASQFESLLHPLVILFSVPFAAIGAVITMKLAGVTLNVVSLIGFVLLAGIVVNDAIVKVDCANQLRRSGLRKLEAMKRAGQLRLRPILMTSATTIFGLLPMALGLGEGAELRTPMALTVIGGMVTSTLLTLLVVPAVYVILDRGE